MGGVRTFPTAWSSGFPHLGLSRKQSTVLCYHCCLFHSSNGKMVFNWHRGNNYSFLLSCYVRFVLLFDSIRRIEKKERKKNGVWSAADFYLQSFHRLNRLFYYVRSAGYCLFIPSDLVGLSEKWINYPYSFYLFIVSLDSNWCFSLFKLCCLLDSIRLIGN